MNEPRSTLARLARRRLLRGAVALGLGAASGLLTGGPSRAAAAAAPAAPPPPPGFPPNKRDDSGITVSPNDPSISTEAVTFPGGAIPIQGYLAAPAGGEVYPGILMLHDVLGLTEHVRDVARRFAKSGYVALAPDFLSSVGGTAKFATADAAQAAMENVPSYELLEEMNESVRYLEARPLVSKVRIGSLGFGLGGGMEWFLLSQNPDVKAAVVFSAVTPDPAIAPHITAAVLAIFGATDTTAMSDLKPFDDAMTKAGVTWEYKVEPKAGHGFFDDAHALYVPAAAQDAWKLALAWFAKYLPA